jgi:hypothetical protein
VLAVLLAGSVVDGRRESGCRKKGSVPPNRIMLLSNIVGHSILYLSRVYCGTRERGHHGMDPRVNPCESLVASVQVDYLPSPVYRPYRAGSRYPLGVLLLVHILSVGRGFSLFKTF